MNRPWMRTAVVLIIFAAVFLALVVGSYRLESATMDEPSHLLAGYTALRLHDYRIDPEHPPLLRMWAALPVLTMREIKLNTNSVHWLKGDLWNFSHEFLYKDNDADRLLMRARFMIALLGVLLGILVFCWARELFGFWPAVIVLGLYCTEPNVLAHSGLVTTDLGAACFIFGAVYFAWRIARQFNAVNLIGLAVFFALAFTSKYSAVLLAPVLFILLLVRTLWNEPWPWSIGQPKLLTSRRSRVVLASVTLVVLVASAYAAIWGAYGFRYAPTPPGGGIFILQDKAYRWPRLAQMTRWIDEHQLLPNASVQGFALTTARSQQRPAFLLGNSSDRGWWYYFPIAFAVKTPIALQLMALAGLTLCVARWKTVWRDALFVIAPPAVYFGAAMVGGLNIGLRHVLLIYPFVLLLAGSTVAALLRKRWRGLALPVLCAAQFVEFIAVYPHCLAFFNVAAGGPRHGAKYLVDSNLDWGQGLKLLKQWMDRNDLEHINLSYFGNADPAYYGIDYTPLTGASSFDVERITAPRLPGYVAISATNLRGAYLNEFGRRLYAPLRERKPVTVLGHSIYVYRCEEPWW